MEKKKANLAMIFCIIAVALELVLTIVGYSYQRIPFRYLFNRGFLINFIITTIIAFIVPVFASFRKGPRAMKIVFAIIAFVFVFIQLIGVLLYTLMYFGERMSTNVISYINGAPLLYSLFFVFRYHDVLIMVIYFFRFVCNALFIVKNIVGAITLLRKEPQSVYGQNTRYGVQGQYQQFIPADQNAPYYPPELAPRGAAYAIPKYAEKYAPRQGK